jgi:hypothetical protein
VPAKQSMLLPGQVLYHTAFFVYQRSLVIGTTVLRETRPWYQTVKLTEAIWSSSKFRTPSLLSNDTSKKILEILKKNSHQLPERLNTSMGCLMDK